jgi:hypothetical protein
MPRQANESPILGKAGEQCELGITTRYRNKQIVYIIENKVYTSFNCPDDRYWGTHLPVD